MDEAQPLKLKIVVEEGDKNTAKPDYSAVSNQVARERKWWLGRVSIYALLVLCGESAATLLGRLYYNKGGQSKWITTLVQVAGFPILLPYYCLVNSKTNNTTTKKPKKSGHQSTASLVMIYTSLGLVNGLVCLFHSIGLSLLPVSTYSLVSATQLSFSALFSFLINSQRLTPYILNSLVLLTLSSILLLFQPHILAGESNNPSSESSSEFVAGFVFTIFGSAGYGLTLSLTQLALQRVMKRETTLSAIMDMTVYVSLASTLAALTGLLCSGEWRGVAAEMEGFKLGKMSYVMTLTWQTVSWQAFNIGAVGLILEVSSLFSNVVSVLSLPVVPVLGVLFFRDAIDAVKVISMVLALWGLMSYLYQHYVEMVTHRGDHPGKRNTVSSEEEEEEEESVEII